MSKIHFPIVSHMKYMSETTTKTLDKDDKVICYFCDFVFPVEGNVVVTDMFDNKALRCPECGKKTSVLYYYDRIIGKETKNGNSSFDNG